MSIPSPDRRAAVDRARSFYDTWSELFVEHAGTTFQAALYPSATLSDPKAVAAESNRRLAARAGVTGGQRILDAGCGVAGPAIAVAAAFDVSVCGVTISPVQVSLGTQFVADAGLGDRVQLHLADYHDLPFADGSFDTILMLEASGYSPDLDRLIGELTRVLAPGGGLYVKDVFRPDRPVSPAQQRELDDYHQTWGVETSWTLAEIESAMSAAGLEIERSQELDEVTPDHLIGSMVDLDRVKGLVPNPMGEHFLRFYDDLLIHYGEVLGRRPKNRRA